MDSAEGPRSQPAICRTARRPRAGRRSSWPGRATDHAARRVPEPGQREARHPVWTDSHHTHRHPGRGVSPPGPAGTPRRPRRRGPSAPWYGRHQQTRSGPACSEPLRRWSRAAASDSLAIGFSSSCAISCASARSASASSSGSIRSAGVRSTRSPGRRAQAIRGGSGQLAARPAAAPAAGPGRGPPPAAGLSRAASGRGPIRTGSRHR